MKLKKKLVKVLCCSFVFLTCLYSLYVPSYALDPSAFNIQCQLYVNGTVNTSMTQYVPMTRGVVYDVYTSDDNKVQIDAFCNVDTGLGYFGSDRFRAFYLSSNSDFSFTLRFYYSSDGVNIYPGTVFYGDPDGTNDISFKTYIYFEEYYGFIGPSFFTITPRVAQFDSYFNDTVIYQDIIFSMNLRNYYPDSKITRVHFVFTLPEQYAYGAPGVIVDEPAFIRVSFQDFSLGDITIDQGNLNEVQQAEQQGQQYQQQVQNMTGIGNVPTVNPIGLVQGSSDFMRWASHTYSIPVLSSMIAITLSFSILFFLLKKR